MFAQETQDVVNALAWSRQSGVERRVRSGGHRLEGWSNVDGGIVIDVSELKSASIDAASGTATVGAGLNQLEAVTARGMASDNLVAAEIVVASDDGGAEAIIVDEHDNADLLCALRGAGNGNFGIVTSLTYRVHALTQTIYLTRTSTFPTQAWRSGRPRTGERASNDYRRSRRSTTPPTCSTSSRAFHRLLRSDPPVSMVARAMTVRVAISATIVGLV